jgi:hypothetical protein
MTKAGKVRGLMPDKDEQPIGGRDVTIGAGANVNGGPDRRDMEIEGQASNLPINGGGASGGVEKIGIRGLESPSPSVGFNGMTASSKPVRSSPDGFTSRDSTRNSHSNDFVPGETGIFNHGKEGINVWPVKEVPSIHSS